MFYFFFLGFYFLCWFGYWGIWSSSVCDLFSEMFIFFLKLVIIDWSMLVAWWKFFYCDRDYSVCRWTFCVSVCLHLFLWWNFQVKTWGIGWGSCGNDEDIMSLLRVWDSYPRWLSDNLKCDYVIFFSRFMNGPVDWVYLVQREKKFELCLKKMREETI